MSTLRIYLDAAPDARREMDWALFDADNRVLRSGRGRRDAWPSADALEGVVAAWRGRIVTLALPPLPAARAPTAVRYALEDQLAGAPEDSHLALAAQAPDGAMRVAIVDDAWFRALVEASARLGLRWQRVVLESDLARPPANGWCWCAAALDAPGFVRTAQGATFAVGPARVDAPPDELVLAITGQRGSRPACVRVDVGGATPALMPQARKLTGVEFVAGEAWNWAAAAAPAWTSAIDLHAAPSTHIEGARRAGALRALRPALWVLALALFIHVIASTGQWAWLAWQTYNARADITALAKAAAPDELAAGLAPASAIARRDAVLRHQAGRVADDDALPLLARTAPALATLPAGALRSLRYADGHVVVDLQKQDAAQSARVQRELQRAGLVAIMAPTATGARIRVGLD
ncbi:MAG: type II secretion system protein GspL [Betaproteobacteria bacterium]